MPVHGGTYFLEAGRGRSLSTYPARTLEELARTLVRRRAAGDEVAEPYASVGEAGRRVLDPAECRRVVELAASLVKEMEA